MPYGPSTKPQEASLIGFGVGPDSGCFFGLTPPPHKDVWTEWGAKSPWKWSTREVECIDGFPKSIKKFHNNPCTEFLIHLCGLQNAKVIVHRRTQQENLASRPQQKPNSKVQYVLEAAFNFQQAPKTWEDTLHKKCLNPHNSTEKIDVDLLSSVPPVWKNICDPAPTFTDKSTEGGTYQRRPQHHCNGFWQQCTSKVNPPWRLQHLRIPLNMHLSAENLCWHILWRNQRWKGDIDIYDI